MADILLSNDDLTKHNTVIIKSEPGTAKTTIMSKLFGHMIENNTNLQVLSIVPRITLAD